MVSIKLDPLNQNNLGIFNRITAPQEYPEQYIDSCKASGDLCRYAYFSEVPVGVLVLQAVNSGKAPVALSIKQMSVLKAYSIKHGVEEKFLEYAINLCPKRHVNSCIMVVKDNNIDIIELLKKHQFEISSSENNIKFGIDTADGETVYVRNV